VFLLFFLQFSRSFLAWEDMSTEWHHVVYTTSIAQRPMLVQAIESADTCNILRIYECNWEKVTRYAGMMLLKDSGPRYCTNSEAVTHIMCGPKMANSSERGPVSPIMFPFWDAAKGLPQSIQDELRVASFRVAFENHGFSVNTSAGVKRANRFEKGMAFGEFLVGVSLFLC
jgi:hypothetical protein